VIGHSAVYVGTLGHARLWPVRHAFGYRLFLLYLDLDELPELLAGPGPLRKGRAGVLAFWRGDYLAGPASLAEAAREQVERALGFRPSGPVRLLTQVRSLGRVFNPVSFYYCFAADGHSLQAVVAEITNTPWGERHAYVVPAGGDGAGGAFPKAFHVSPFFGMAQTYRWAFTAPGDRLEVEMSNEEAGREVFRARLTLERRPWNARGLWRVALGFPLASLRVHAAIYWQALRLWLRRAPFFEHPGRAALRARRLP
jgi:uncharacterized protein